MAGCIVKLPKSPRRPVRGTHSGPSDGGDPTWQMVQRIVEFEQAARKGGMWRGRNPRSGCRPVRAHGPRLLLAEI